MDSANATILAPGSRTPGVPRPWIVQETSTGGVAVQGDIGHLRRYITREIYQSITSPPAEPQPSAA